MSVVSSFSLRIPNIFFIELQVRTLVQTYDKYKMLKISSIPGIFDIYTELNNILSIFANKRENILNITTDILFENDHVKFHNEVEKWTNRLRNHLTAEIDGLPSFESKIELLKKYDELNIDDLGLDHVYTSTIKNLIICN